MEKLFGIIAVFGSVGWAAISNLVVPAGPFTVGQVVKISWTVTSSSDEYYEAVYFSSTGSAPWDSVAQLSPVTINSYNWTVPNKITTTGKLWVFHADPASSPRPTNPPASDIHTLVSNSLTIRAAAPILSGGKVNHLLYRQMDNVFTLDFGGQSFRNAIVEISALNGKTLQVSKLQNGSSLSLSTTQLPAGNAILRYSADGLPKSSHLILIQH